MEKIPTAEIVRRRKALQNGKDPRDFKPRKGKGKHENKKGEIDLLKKFFR